MQKLNFVPGIDLSGTSDELPQVQNLVSGEWQLPKKMRTILHPVTGEDMYLVPDTELNEMDEYSRNLKEAPKSGLHNPLKNPERYLMLGKVTERAAAYLSTEDGLQYFTGLTQLAMPKSYKQCKGEVVVTRDFLLNFTSDRVRFLGKGSNSPGSHTGQQPNSFRWPYGASVIIFPFNFPIEIPVLQLMGALYMGNKVLIKGDSKVSIVLYEFLRLLHACGLPQEDVDFINCRGGVMGEFLRINAEHIKLCQFTGSSDTAELVSKTLNGKVRLEDAGFDWKILGPDVPKNPKMKEYIEWQCDQDAYAASGQKCSAQSILFVHDNWINGSDLMTNLKALAERRKLEDLTVGPVLSWNTESLLAHIDALLRIPGSDLMFGGKELSDHAIPLEYGAIEPTAVFIPFKEIKNHFKLVTTEVFAPFQVVTQYGDSDVSEMLEILEGMDNHLTAAVVSNDPIFQQRILEATVNGTTYCGWRARTTGAPQNHFFGPANDPRAAGIGTEEAILMTWSCHREIVYDQGDVNAGWTLPDPS